MAETVTGIAQASYLPASFNGIPFTAVECGSEHGRRGAEGEFPFGENTAYADLGRRIRTYSLSGRVQTDAFAGITAALIAACESPGPGILVHPTRGIISAACRSIKVSDKVETEQGVTYVDLDFVEANAWPNGLSLIGSILGLVIGTIITAARTSFRERYVIKEVPKFKRNVPVAAAQAALSNIRTEYARATTLTTDQKVWRALSDLQFIIDDPVLLEDTALVDRAITIGMNGLSTQTEKADKYDAFRRIANQSSKASTLTGTGQDAEDAVYAFVRTLAGVYMAQAANEVDYTTMGDAFNAIDAVVTILQDEADLACARCDNRVYMALRDFITEVQTILYNKAYKTPRIVAFDFAGGVHAVVAAYAIFGDAKRHRELERANVINASGRFDRVVAAAYQKFDDPHRHHALERENTINFGVITRTHA